MLSQAAEPLRTVDMTVLELLHSQTSAGLSSIAGDVRWADQKPRPKIKGEDFGLNRSMLWDGPWRMAHSQGWMLWKTGE